MRPHVVTMILMYKLMTWNFCQKRYILGLITKWLIYRRKVEGRYWHWRWWTTNWLLCSGDTSMVDLRQSYWARTGSNTTDHDLVRYCDKEEGSIRRKRSARHRVLISSWWCFFNYPQLSQIGFINYH